MPHDVLYNISASLKDISKALNAINTNLCSIAHSLEEIKNQKTPKVAVISSSKGEWALDSDPTKWADVVYFEEKK